jgi:hypothetical protein
MSSPIMNLIQCQEIEKKKTDYQNKGRERKEEEILESK